MKNKNNKVQTKPRTITFQPSETAKLSLQRALGDAPERGVTSDFINEAIALHAHAVAVSLAERDLAEAQARLELLVRRGKAAGAGR